MYELYDRYFAGLSEHRIVLLELGIHTGESLKVFATFFSKGRVIGVDWQDRRIDLSAYRNATVAFGDQRDSAWLAALAAREAPGGLDIVIDDASHRGAWSFASYWALFPRLKPGGLYIIEDWGTGYIEDWPDGARFVSHTVGDKRIASHDFGMVGFIKSLVDETSGRSPRLDTPALHPRTIEWLHVHQSMVIAKKASAA
jgi:cephalosporin hydroxylase